MRAAGRRLKGLRCIHTHLAGEAISEDDLMDLLFLRLDLMAVLKVREDGLAERLYPVHLVPEAQQGKNWQFLPPVVPAQQSPVFLELITALEAEFSKLRPLNKVEAARDRAILVSVTTEPKAAALDSLAELMELAGADGIVVLDSVMQRCRKINPRFIIGRGKLSEIMLKALLLNANLLIFDQELNARQVSSIAEHTELRIIDRTQLILDIFAQRARTREGKLQVELAQLKYLLPRLVVKNTAMSRLTGGIGGRGPGETKLEINRRRARERIARLEKALLAVRQQRSQQKAQRRKKALPVISIIGYTNAGKSTLLNTLTKSKVVAESRLFATLDPSSRRLRFPRDFEVIITDTVGFIRDLPKDLMAAFRATLEELESADLLLHIIDISNPRFEEQIKSVENILADLNLQNTATMRVLNKIDRVDSQTSMRLGRQLKGTAVSAKSKSTLVPLIEEMETLLECRMSKDE